jgi:hypothetical protein
MRGSFAAGMAGIALAAGLAGCAGPTEEQKAAATAAKPLSGPELSQLIAGNGLTGRSRTGKSQWTEYYEPSGTIVGGWKSSGGAGQYGGAWKVEGDKFCGDYEGSENDGCWTIAVNGDKVYFLGEDGMAENSDRPATLVNGKPGGL